jgi:hypothetical protein
MSRKKTKPQRPKRVTVLMEPALASRFERFCRERGFKKSTLAARLVREHLDSEEFDKSDATKG